MRMPIYTDEGNAVKVQKHVLADVGRLNRQVSRALDELERRSGEDADDLDAMLAQAEGLCGDVGVDPARAADPIDLSAIDALLADIEVEHDGRHEMPKIDTLEKIEIGTDWDAYMRNIDTYAEAHEIDFSRDPLQDLLTPDERRDIIQKIEDDYKLYGTADCDKWDYALSALCGAATGLIDAFFVGMPGASKLGKITNEAADKVVEKFAKVVHKFDKKHVDKLIESGEITKYSDYKPTGMSLPKKEPEGIASSIGYLEQRFRVPYDARYASDLLDAPGGVSFNPTNHHLMSAGHCPDLAGLFFSVLDQFDGKITLFTSRGILRLTPKVQDFRLQGKNLYQKVLFGFINWIGHLMSDVVGSSGTRGHEGRVGAGIAPPFFEFFQLCNFGSFDVNGDTKTLAEFTTTMYERGYDARFAVAQAIPVALNEVLIRLIWSIKRHYYHGLPWKECVPLKLSNKPELRRMLLVGHGCLCLVDATDAAIRSWGNLIEFALRLNIVAWTRFAHLGLQELRAYFKKDALNTEAMEDDLRTEWKNLLAESGS